MLKIIKNKAFTLAEVLVTLGIIGVVAALTIPVVINHFQELQYASAAKKTVAVLSDAMTRIATDNGGTMVGVWPTHGDIHFGSTTPSFGARLAQYLKYEKFCGSTPQTNNTTQCWHKNGTVKTEYNTYRSWCEGCSVIQLYQGIWATVDPDTEANMADCTGSATNVSGHNICVGFYVDTNGIKGPNEDGKDIHRLFVNSYGKIVYANNKSIHTLMQK